MDFHSIYLISNGSQDFYPENKLTSFTNHVPWPIEFSPQEKWEVGVESFGISCNFKRLDVETNAPHILITKCQTEDRKCEETCRGEKPVKFNFQSCIWHKFNLPLEGKEIVSGTTFQKLSDQIAQQTGIIMTYINGRLSFDLNDTDKKSQESYWIFFNKKFSNAFGLSGELIRTKEFSEVNSLTNDYDQYYKINYVNINGKVYSQREAKFENEEYNIYNIGLNQLTKKHVQLTSDFFVLEKNYPKLIKIICNIIEPQIFNSTFSKDLLIFSPDFKKTENYFFKEIDCVDYIPLVTSRITEVSIKLTDENNQQLNLSEGQATIIKLRLKRMAVNKRSFNIRLSSEPTTLFPDNTNYKFKVKLPYQIDLGDEKWRVCINSLNHPTKFSTMLVGEEDRMILFKQKNKQAPFKLQFKNFFAYDESSLFDEFNFFLQSNEIGEISAIPSGGKRINITKPGKLIISKFVGGVLGLSNDVSKHFQFSSAKNSIDPHSWDASTTSPKMIDIPSTAKLSLLQPNYIMIYSDIVKSTAIAGNFAKILKIVPLKNTDFNYVIQEFRTKEMVELEKSQLDVIEIQLRSHDGRYINFLTNQDIIVNLEFTNYYE